MVTYLIIFGVWLFIVALYESLFLVAARKPPRPDNRRQDDI